MMVCKDRETGFRAAIQLAKYCGIVTEIADRVAKEHGDDAVAYTGARDQVSDSMRRVHHAMGVPLPGDPVQLRMFEQKRV